MNEAVILNGINLSPELAPILTRITQYLELSLYRAATRAAYKGYLPRPKTGSVEQVLTAFLTDRMQKRGARGRRDIVGLSLSIAAKHKALKATPKALGPLAKVDIDSQQSIPAQLSKGILADQEVAALTKPLAAEVVRLSHAMRRVQDPRTLAVLTAASLIKSKSRGSAAAAPSQPPPAAPKVYQSLKLKFIKLECAEKVALELTDWGEDHILTGGKAYDTAGTQLDKGPRTAFMFTGAGQVKSWSPAYTFAAYDLSANGTWPCTFGAVIDIAEKDLDEGFIEFLQKIWDAIGPEVIAGISTAVATALGAGAGAAGGAAIAAGGTAAAGGAAAGATAGAPAAGVGALVGALVGAAVGILVYLIFDSMRDDIFAIEQVMVILMSASTGFDGNGSQSSPIYQLEFTRQDGKGRYMLSYQWQLE